MAVFRIERTRDYTVMSNHHLRNANLSLKAKGLLSMMLSLPEDWNYTTRGRIAGSSLREESAYPTKENSHTGRAAEGQSAGGHSGKIAGRKRCWLCSLGQGFQSETNGTDHELLVRA